MLVAVVRAPELPPVGAGGDLRVVRLRGRAVVHVERPLLRRACGVGIDLGGRSEVVRGTPPARSLALRLQTAVAIELLIMAPVRLGNLARLRIGTHLLIGREGGMTVVLPREEVKNGMPIEIALPAPSVRLIALYLSSHRPGLAASDSAWLFPGRGGGAPKTASSLHDQIKRCIAARCGLRFNPHLFRHLAAKITLDANPGAYGQVQRILGHKSINTTMSYYTGAETQAAFRHYDALVMKTRGDLPATAMPAGKNGTGRRSR